MWEDHHRPITDRNDFTDDTDQMLVMLQSLQQTQDGILHPINFARRLTEWENHGIIEIGADPGRGLGYTVGRVLSHRDFSSNPHRAAFEVRLTKQLPMGTLSCSSAYTINLTRTRLPIGVGFGRPRLGSEWRSDANCRSRS